MNRYDLIIDGIQRGEIDAYDLENIVLDIEEWFNESSAGVAQDWRAAQG